MSLERISRLARVAPYAKPFAMARGLRMLTALHIRAATSGGSVSYV